MRGSLKTQLAGVLKQLDRIGESRHQAKTDHGGKSPFIHSKGTMEKTFVRLIPLLRWMNDMGIEDMEALCNAASIAEYLRERLDHHMDCGNSRQAFKVELSALAALERGLSAFSINFRNSPIKYDFAQLREEYARLAKALPKRTSEYTLRAISDPILVIASLEDETHRLMARLQWEGGCRAEGVGAPTRGRNPFHMGNFQHPDSGEDMGLCEDPVTKHQAAPYWTKEKGGKVAFKFCSPNLRCEILNYLRCHKELEAPYTQYLWAINKALEQTGQAAKGRGTHALRCAFARRRYAECLQNGYSDTQAKFLVSREMSHNRGDITEGYLGCKRN